MGSDGRHGSDKTRCCPNNPDNQQYPHVPIVCGRSQDPRQKGEQRLQIKNEPALVHWATQSSRSVAMLWLSQEGPGVVKPVVDTPPTYTCATEACWYAVPCMVGVYLSESLNPHICAPFGNTCACNISPQKSRWAANTGLPSGSQMGPSCRNPEAAPDLSPHWRCMQQHAHHYPSQHGMPCMQTNELSPPCAIAQHHLSEIWRLRSAWLGLRAAEALQDVI